MCNFFDWECYDLCNLFLSNSVILNKCNMLHFTQCTHIELKVDAMLIFFLFKNNREVKTLSLQIKLFGWGVSQYFASFRSKKGDGGAQLVLNLSFPKLIFLIYRAHQLEKAVSWSVTRWKSDKLFLTAPCYRGYHYTFTCIYRDGISYLRTVVIV